MANITVLTQFDSLAPAMSERIGAVENALETISGEGGTADLTEVNDAITNLTSKVTALESYHAEVTGIEQLKSGFKFRHCQTVDSDAMIFIPKLYVKNESENGLIKR